MAKIQTGVMVGMIVVGLFTGCLADEERDPFNSILDLSAKLAEKASAFATSKIDLKGVIWTDTKAVAILNDDIVTEGTTWQGFKVDKIREDRVTLSSGEEQYTIQVPEETLIPQDTNTSTVQSAQPTPPLNPQELLNNLLRSSNMNSPPWPQGGAPNSAGGMPSQGEKR